MERNFMYSGSFRTLLIKATGGVFILSIISLALGFIISLLLARALGSIEFGIYNYIGSWLDILLIVSLLGLPLILTRNLSIYYTRREWGLMQGIMRYSRLVTIGMSLIVILTTGLIACALSQRGSGLDFAHQSSLTVTFLFALLIVPTETIVLINEAAMAGLHEVVYGQIPRVLFRPLVFICVIGLLYLMPKESISALLAIGLQFITLALVALYGMFILWKTFPVVAKQTIPIYATSTWTLSALPLLLTNGTKLLTTKFGTLFLGSTVGMEQVSFLSVAILFSGLISLPLVAASSAIVPNIASLYTSGEIKRLQKMMIRSSRGTFMIAMLIALLVMIFSRQLLRIYGPEYPQASSAVIILSLTQLVSVGCGSVGYLLTMTGHEWDTFKILATSLMINIVLNLFLIPVLGLNGAAIANAISTVFWNLILVIIVWRRLRIHTTVLGVIKLPRRLR